MTKKLLSLSLKGIMAFLLLQGGVLIAQNANITGDSLEHFTDHMWNGLAKVEKLVGANDADFAVFQRFYQNRIISEEGKLYSDVESGKITEAGMDAYENAIIKEYTALYKKFLVIKKEYPSSVAEYSKYYPNVQANNCDSACNNPDFANGTLSGWNAYYGYNGSLNTQYFNVTGVTGGPAGPVNKAAQDPLTGNSYQVMIVKGGYDPIVPTVPRVSPYSSSQYSARIGDSTAVNYGVAIVDETFKVTAASSNFTYQYAVFLENPPNHGYYQQPFFAAVVLDSVGDTIPNCGKYLVTSGYGTGGKGWDSTFYFGTRLYYRDWTTVFVSLKNYIGHCVTMRFTVGDCAQGGHFGYAYVSASCNPSKLISSSPAFCGQKTITLTGPPGGSSYTWTGPTNGIVGSDSTQSITIDSAGTYQVIIEPVTGAACNDTVKITVPKAQGPPPVPSFLADTFCVGQPLPFVNTSNPLSGPNVKFYWDFYNTGLIEDSTTNPIWTYNAPGIYTVKLNEINKGCGADTLIKIKVDSTVTGAFTYNGGCLNNPVYFTNQSIGASKYQWIFGDPHSGKNDTSLLQNPQHTFDTAGTYIVTMVARNGTACPDTVKETIKLAPLPIPKITGKDSVCPGGSTTLTGIAPGGISYQWTYSSGTVSCPTCNITQVTPVTTTTYTLTVSNGTCTGDTTFTVYVIPNPVVTINAVPTDTVCFGDSILLAGKGGCTYLWNNGKTSASIWVRPIINTTYSVTGTCLGCSANAAQAVIVAYPTIDSIHLAKDNICPTDSTTITAYGGASYKWLPPLVSNNNTVTVKSNNTITYSVVVTSRCNTDTLKQTLHIVPLPKITFTGDTAICATWSTTLNATGGSFYTWSNGATSSSITVTPATTTTYTVSVSNGTCTSDSSITVYVEPTPTVTVTPPNTICIGSPITLVATTSFKGVSYLWSNGATNSSITVSPTSTTTYTVVVSKLCKDSALTTIKVDAPGLYACCDTQILKGDTANLQASGQKNYSWTPADGLSCYNCPNPIATPTVTTTYTVTSTDSNGCVIARTITVIVDVPCADFVVPNVFTPNNDGRNDDFVIRVLNPSSYSIIIYDRWGKQMYSSNDPDKYWTGRINNTENMVPDGVYYYIIKATCGDNNYVKKGFVHVMGNEK